MADRNEHPQYSKMAPKWVLVNDSFEGESAIKERGSSYLPYTQGQILDGADNGSTTKGAADYKAYKKRAVYPDIYTVAVQSAVGVMHRKPPTIELPEALEGMRKKATLLGESLEQLLQNINTRQLISGRLGILGDIHVNESENGQPVEEFPYISMYEDLCVINWNDGAIEGVDANLTLVVLDESGYKMDVNLQWQSEERFRYLGLVNPQDKQLDPNGVYASAVFDESEEFTAEKFEEPNVKGERLSEIPFSFINASDISPTPSKPPLLGLADSCLTIYRGEADYRQSLFMQGQDTLVIIGAQTSNKDKQTETRTGSGSKLVLPKDGDAKYIGVSSQGLSEQRTALENDYRRAIEKSGQLTDSSSRSKESGEALKIRMSAQSATLPQIAKAGAAGLEKVLKSLAKWYGADPEAVKVTPNLEFTEQDLNGETIVKMVQAKSLGAPISDETIHEYLREKGFTSLDYETEKSLIEGEEPTI